MFSRDGGVWGRWRKGKERKRMRVVCWVSSGSHHVPSQKTCIQLRPWARTGNRLCPLKHCGNVVCKSGWLGGVTSGSQWLTPLHSFPPSLSPNSPVPLTPFGPSRRKGLSCPFQRPTNTWFQLRSLGPVKGVMEILNNSTYPHIVPLSRLVIANTCSAAFKEC